MGGNKLKKQSRSREKVATKSADGDAPDGTVSQERIDSCCRSTYIVHMLDMSRKMFEELQEQTQKYKEVRPSLRDFSHVYRQLKRDRICLPNYCTRGASLKSWRISQKRHSVNPFSQVLTARYSCASFPCALTSGTQQRIASGPTMPHLLPILRVKRSWTGKSNHFSTISTRRSVSASSLTSKPLWAVHLTSFPPRRTMLPHQYCAKPLTQMPSR